MTAVHEVENSSIVPPSPPAWLSGCAAGALALPEDALSWRALSGDAGSRRYYRLAAAGATHLAVVDSSLAQQETFVRLRRLFAEAGARVPQVLAQGTVGAEGWLLIEDFGDAMYAHCPPDEKQALYQAALQTLVALQGSAALAAALPRYDEKMLMEEMQLFEEWYCPRHLQRPLPPRARQALAAAQRFLCAEMLAQPPVAVHRDYHCRNLMVCESGASPGVLDFQDAVCGSALYDVVSLLRDAYVEFSAAEQQAWLQRYWEMARAAGVAAAGECFGDCQRRFNIAGAQRGLKVLGIFSRLAYRDGKARYLDDLPLVYAHTLSACAAVAALEPLAELLANYPPP